jgi:hypothetical protein
MWSSGQSSWLQIQRSGFDSQSCQISEKQWALNPVAKAENTADGICHADHMALSIRKSWH